MTFSESFVKKEDKISKQEIENLQLWSFWLHAISLVNLFLTNPVLKVFDFDTLFQILNFKLIEFKANFYLKKEFDNESAKLIRNGWQVDIFFTAFVNLIDKKTWNFEN